MTQQPIAERLRIARKDLQRVRRNLRDNQGARYLIGPLYHLTGDLQGALLAYELLLGEWPPKATIWHWTNLAEPDYAKVYLPLYEGLWRRSPEALNCLHQLWNDSEIQADVKRYLEIGKQLEVSAGVARKEDRKAQAEWQRLIRERRAIEERVPSDALVMRVVGEELFNEGQRSCKRSAGPDQR